MAHESQNPKKGKLSFQDIMITVLYFTLLFISLLILKNILGISFPMKKKKSCFSNSTEVKDKEVYFLNVYK